MNKTKYNNQNPMNIPEDKEEIKKAVKEWSEGNSKLENLIFKSLEKNLLTFVSCGGHEEKKEKFPHIGYKLEDKDIEIMQKIIENLILDKNKELLKILSFALNKEKMLITFHTNFENRYKLFEEILNVLEEKENKKKKKTKKENEKNEIFKNILNLEKEVKNIDEKTNLNIIFTNIYKENLKLNLIISNKNTYIKIKDLLEKEKYVKKILREDENAKHELLKFYADFEKEVFKKENLNSLIKIIINSLY